MLVQVRSGIQRFRSERTRKTQSPWCSRNKINAVMSLYHEAAGILQAVRKEQASVKSLVFSKKGWKSDPKTLFALSTEAAKWSEVLSEALEKSGILGVEKQVSITTMHRGH